MKGVASIVYEGGGTILPARSTPYDREVVLDYVRDLARSRQVVHLEFAGRRFLVSYDAELETSTCSRCARTTRLFGREIRDHQHSSCLHCLLAFPTAKDTADHVRRRPPQSDLPIEHPTAYRRQSATP